LSKGQSEKLNDFWKCLFLGLADLWQLYAPDRW